MNDCKVAQTFVSLSNLLHSFGLMMVARYLLKKTMSQVQSMLYVILYFVETSTWSRPKACGMVPAARDGHTACVINHRMYIFGGFEEEIDRFSNDVYYLDLGSMKWYYVTASVSLFSDDLFQLSIIPLRNRESILTLSLFK